MYLKSTDLSVSLPQVTKLASLIVTIPATSAGAERSFSCLKRIKTHLRNSQSQNKLSDLSLLTIEKQLLTTLQNQNSFYDYVIDDFTKKTRRIDLIYINKCYYYLLEVFFFFNNILKYVSKLIYGGGGKL
jgi:hypothetical protein